MTSRKWQFVSLIILVVVVLSINGNVNAAPTSIGLGDFSGSETVIDFETIGDEVLIDTQFSGQSVNFGGAIYGMTNPGDVSLFPTIGSVIASNWLYSLGSNQGTSFTAAFDNTQNRVGFYAETNSPDSTTISVELGGNPNGPISFDTSQSVIFIGIEDLSGFDSVTISISGPDNNFLAIDDFRFEAIPEPTTLSLAALSLLAIAYRRR